MGCGASKDGAADANTGRSSADSSALEAVTRTPAQLKRIITMVSPTWITLCDANGQPESAVSYFGKSHPGRDPMNPVKNNQDNIVVHEINTEPGTPTVMFFAVFDGHGNNGCEVSEYVKQNMTKLVAEALKTPAGKSALEKGDLGSQFLKAAKTTQAGLGKLGIDLTTSGSTGCMCIMTSSKLHMANVGDSRAVMCRNFADGTKKTVRLTRDHKPTDPEEQMRITKAGGTVRQMTIEGVSVGPARVFVKGQDLPGLCMGRSFGDAMAQTVGVVCDPEMKTYDLLEGADTAHMVIGSDGIYEFIDDEEILKMAGYSTIDMGVEAIIEKARAKWVQEESHVIDDCTALLLHIKKKKVPPKPAS